MVIQVRDHVQAADTHQQGSAVHARILSLLRQGHNVEISFSGIDTATSSFVNACFVELLGFLSLDEVKKRVRVVDSTRQINDMIRRRMVREAEAA